MLADFVFNSIVKLNLILADPFRQERRTKFPGPSLLKHRENNPVAAVIHGVNRAFFFGSSTSFSEIKFSQASFSFYQLGKLNVFHELYWHSLYLLDFLGANFMLLFENVEIHPQKNY